MFRWERMAINYTSKLIIPLTKVCNHHVLRSELPVSPPPGYQQNYGPPAGNSGGPPPAQGYPNNQYGPGAGGQPNYQNGPPNGAGGWSLPPLAHPQALNRHFRMDGGKNGVFSIMPGFTSTHQSNLRNPNGPFPLRQDHRPFLNIPPLLAPPSGAPGTAPPPTNDQKTAERDGPNFPGGPPGPAMNNYGAATAPPSNGNWGAPPNSYGPPQGTPAPGGNLAFGGQNPADRNGSNGYSAPPNPSAPPANNSGPRPTIMAHLQATLNRITMALQSTIFLHHRTAMGHPHRALLQLPEVMDSKEAMLPLPTGNAPPDAAAAAKKKGMLGAGLGVLGGLALGAFANHEWHEHERHEEERQEEAYEAGIHDALRF
ncbi:hypothetical protein KEM48_008924 [Puccinia striiformis f. sp. tritici PST-130]|nr:hypothetical protein KEM48_008924 [Puccinia striiformis f. sp. tritici PST-130]